MKIAVHNSHTTRCFFTSDLHGQADRYEKLFRAIGDERPAAVFLGGDLLPSGLHNLASMDFAHLDFVNDLMVPGFSELKVKLGPAYPRVFVILGNDDGRFPEAAIVEAATRGIWEYAHNRRFPVGDYEVYGYAYVPPTPFQLKDWERFDVSRYVDPGCIPPEDGRHSFPVGKHELKYATIQQDLEQLAGQKKLPNAVFLFHTPPYQTNLDQAALDGWKIDHAPLDLHVGSIAVRRFIETRQPQITLHGHIHESPRITGSWKDLIGETHCFSAAHDGSELALVKFEMEKPETAVRELI